MIFYRRWQPVKAITFDLDDTFYDNHPYIRKAEAEQFAFMHQHFPASQALTQAHWQRIRKQVILQNPSFKGDMIKLRRAVLTLGLAECGLTGQALEDAVEAIYQHFFFYRSDFQIRDEVKVVLKSLSAKYPLVAITNGNVDMERVGLAPYFSLALHASTLQPMKPSPVMFNKAASFLKLAPQHILHVGDHLKKDVWAAIQCGYRAGWYADNREMRLQSESVNVLPDVAFSHLKELVDLLC